MFGEKKVVLLVLNCLEIGNDREFCCFRTVTFLDFVGDFWKHEFDCITIMIGILKNKCGKSETFLFSRPGPTSRDARWSFPPKETVAFARTVLDVNL